jgi:hypothetical protein
MPKSTMWMITVTRRGTLAVRRRKKAGRGAGMGTLISVRG